MTTPSPEKPETILPFVLTLFFVIAMLEIALYRMPSIQESQLLLGSTVHRSWLVKLSIDAGDDKYYPVNQAWKEYIEKNTTIVSTGGIVWTQKNPIQVTPMSVSWKSGRTASTVLGAQLEIEGECTTTTRASMEDRQGSILLQLPKVPNGVKASILTHDLVLDAATGNAILSKVTILQKESELVTRPLWMALWYAIPYAMMIHAVLWMMILLVDHHQEEKTSKTGTQLSLPHVFRPRKIITRIGAIISFLSGAAGAVFIWRFDPLMDMLGQWGAGLSILSVIPIAIIAARIAKRKLYYAIVDTDHFSYAQAPEESSWKKVPWREIVEIKPTEIRTYGRVIRRWVEVTLSTGDVKTFSQSYLVHYAAFLEIMLALHTQNRDQTVVLDAG